MNPWLIALAVLGIVILLIFVSMIPELRRYLRMRRM